MDPALGIPHGLLRTLLTCGIIAAILYAITDILGILIQPGYNFVKQSIGMLTAPGTAARPFVLAGDIIADLILLAFALGVWVMGEGNWAMRVMAVLIAVNALTALTSLAFFPMRPEQAVSSQANRLNIVLMATSMFCFVLAIIFGIPANHNWLGYVSLGIILFFAAATVIGLLIARPHGADTTGLQERTMMYMYVAWLIMQATVLLRTM